MIGREPVMRISTSLLALCCQSGLDATLATPMRARRRSIGSRSLRMSPLLIARFTSARIASHNVSSGLGSLTKSGDPAWTHVAAKYLGYAASKAEHIAKLGTRAVRLPGEQCRDFPAQAVRSNNGSRVRSDRERAIQRRLFPDPETTSPYKRRRPDREYFVGAGARQHTRHFCCCSANLDYVEISVCPDSASVPAANSPNFLRRP